MKVKDISHDNIYVSKIPNLPMPIYGYIRTIRAGEVGFSVLEEPVEDPDFSNCGVFYVKPKDFTRVFEVYR